MTAIMKFGEATKNCQQYNVRLNAKSLHFGTNLIAVRHVVVKFTFCVSRRRREMYNGHVRLSVYVCLFV